MTQIATRVAKTRTQELRAERRATLAIMLGTLAVLIALWGCCPEPGCSTVA